MYNIEGYEFQLEFGAYRFKASYLVSSVFENGTLVDEIREEAEIDFVLTAKGKVVETIDFWASIIADPETSDRELDRAINDIQGFSFQEYAFSDSTLEARRRAAEEYSLWARFRGVSLPIVNDHGDEILEYPERIRRLPLELFDFGGFNQTTTMSSVTLSGKVRTFFSGFDSITITNSRLPGTEIEASRVEYDGWNASVPILMGSNRLSLVARDLRGVESTTIISFTREEL